MSEQVILVDDDDRELGSADKLDAHLDPRLHRAFSVFIFRRSGETLIQRRATGKYHSAGLWSNACCGHPRPGEATAAAAERRRRGRGPGRGGVAKPAGQVGAAAVGAGRGRHRAADDRAGLTGQRAGIRTAGDCETRRA